MIRRPPFSTRTYPRFPYAALFLSAAASELAEVGECTFLRCDVTDDDSVAAAVGGAVAAYGRLDAAFNAAGIDGEHGKRLAERTIDNWQRVIAVDLTGPFSCMTHAHPRSEGRR